jgi:predicted amino acid-binding ACT domain protein
MMTDRLPFPNRTELERLRSEVDEAAHRRPLVAAVRETPAAPAYGEPQRDAINSLVDGIVRDVTEKIADLRSKLDNIEQTVLEGAADTKAKLQDHVRTMIRINDEVVHMAEVIRDMASAHHDGRS